MAHLHLCEVLRAHAAPSGAGGGPELRSLGAPAWLFSLTCGATSGGVCGPDSCAGEALNDVHPGTGKVPAGVSRGAGRALNVACSCAGRAQEHAGSDTGRVSSLHPPAGYRWV